MSLDPDAETLLEMMRAAGRAPMETLSPNEARQQFAAGRAVTQPDPQDELGSLMVIDAPEGPPPGNTN